MKTKKELLKSNPEFHFQAVCKQCDNPHFIGEVRASKSDAINDGNDHRLSHLGHEIELVKRLPTNDPAELVQAFCTKGDWYGTPNLPISRARIEGNSHLAANPSHKKIVYL